MIDDFQKIQKYMNALLEKSLKVYFSRSYDPIIEYQVTKQTHIIINECIKNKFPDYPSEYYPQFRIKRSPKNRHQMILQIQENFNSLKGWKYIGTLSMPSSVEFYDIYLRYGFGMEEFTLMTKHGHDPKNIEIGGYRAAAEYEAQVMTPLSMAYDYALSEGEI